MLRHTVRMDVVGMHQRVVEKCRRGPWKLQGEGTGDVSTLRASPHPGTFPWATLTHVSLAPVTRTRPQQHALSRVNYSGDLSLFGDRSSL